jgi:hypothetical protein
MPAATAACRWENSAWTSFVTRVWSKYFVMLLIQFRMNARVLYPEYSRDFAIRLTIRELSRFVSP